ncbi:MAG: hypothetical protein IJS59_01700 [Bacteroidaceae bacterium]|nr:hypothetical protein [Bacteroidaceae bacterium]
MKKLTEGRKMYASIMVVFAVYAGIFILFEDYDRRFVKPFHEASDWHLLLFSIAAMTGLAWLLHGYARRMDERISREQQQRQSELRRELTQNIAHELKTPVACILGYTDTILRSPDMDDATRHKFISRANAQAQQLTQLLQDISTLNKMDYAPEMLRRERVELSPMVADIVEEARPRLAARQMTFSNCLPPGIALRGNWQMLYSIFHNLTDNAINHAGQHTTIELSATHGADGWHFTFADNGAGVAPEHLPRLFERFYRVDKSRSRDLGGTGLGLAIVKNAVVLHGGSISVCAAEGGGLRFDFVLP